MKSKAELRKEIEAQTAQFLQGGGRVTKLDMHQKRGAPKPPKELTDEDLANLPPHLRALAEGKTNG
jgi:hypothetical protein